LSLEWNRDGMMHSKSDDDDDDDDDIRTALRKNPKFSLSFSYVFPKFIESYKVKFFTEF